MLITRCLFLTAVWANVLFALPPIPHRTDTIIDGSWRFSFGDTSDAPSFPDFKESGWTGISLPHTWNGVDGQDGGNDYARGTGWYRRTLRLNPELEGERLYLQFDGANAVTTLFVNGVKIGEHIGGYARFRFEVTGYLVTGRDNTIAVKVNNAHNPDVPPLDADFTFYGGIYRHVHLLATNPLSIDCMDCGSSGVYEKQIDVTSAGAEVDVTARVSNGFAIASTGNLRVRVLTRERMVVAEAISPFDVAGGSTVAIVRHLSIASPHLWDGKADPYLYHVVAEIMQHDTVVDAVVEPLGVRSCSVSPTRGFFLNGRHYDVHGVNKHQDRPGKGWAISESDMDEDFTLMNEMGVTAVRLAHYQHPQHEYDLADSLGMVVWAEIPVVNHITKGEAFTRNARQMLRELIRQNINHPSIAFWSIANEVTLQKGPDPNDLLAVLASDVHAEDSTRLCALASDAQDDNPANFHTDVTGFNKYFGWYHDSTADFARWADRIHQRPEWTGRCVGVTEYGAGSSIRFHADSVKVQDHTEEYQCRFHETYWKAIVQHPFLWGTFVWVMFDFAADHRNEGDTPGRNDKGLVTFDRKTRKDSFFWYKANWTNEPVVHITGQRFNPRTAGMIDVTVYSNLAALSLSLNGVDLGTRTSTDRIFRWSGVALNKGANLVCAEGKLGERVILDQATWDH